MCSEIARLNIVNKSVLPSLIYRFNVIPIKIPVLFCGFQQINSKVHMERQKTQKSQHNIEE